MNSRLVKETLPSFLTQTLISWTTRTECVVTHYLSVHLVTLTLWLHTSLQWKRENAITLNFGGKWNTQMRDVRRLPWQCWSAGESGAQLAAGVSNLLCVLQRREEGERWFLALDCWQHLWDFSEKNHAYMSKVVSKYIYAYSSWKKGSPKISFGHYRQMNDIYVDPFTMHVFNVIYKTARGRN